ncbi:MAG: glutathione S-transferase family protein [Gammaproteobacteria bacterium]|nr:glutathione S-transferase family protein [Gammaproteobacteria bacterium]
MWTLYIANKNYSSWSLRPWVLLRELGIPFSERLVPFDYQKSDQFRSFSPTGKVPCLVDGEVVVWDSLAIAEYAAEKYPAVWPADRVQRAWARSVSAEMHSGFSTVRNHCGMNCGVRVSLHNQPPALLAEWARIDALWCEGIERFGGPFLAGDRFTAADAFFAPVAFRVLTYAPALSPVAVSYAERLRTLGAMRDWYAAALVEPWRDPPHDAEILEYGTVTEDLRKSS